MAIEIRYFDSVTDIRRVLKKLSSSIKHNLKSIDTCKSASVIALAVMGSGNSTRTHKRVALKTHDLIDVKKRSQALTELTEHDKLLAHLTNIINHELPADEFLVKKLRIEITGYREQIAKAQAQSFAENRVVKLPSPFKEQFAEVVEWLKAVLAYDVLQTKTLLTAETSALCLNGYICISDVEDSSSYNYKSYYVVVRRSSTGDLHLAISQSFNTPDSLTYTKVTAESLLPMVKQHFTANRLVTALETKC